LEEQRLGTILWRGKWLIIVSLVVTLGLAVAATRLSDKVYEATAIFQVNSPGLNPGDSADLANQGLAKNYATVIVSRSFVSSIRSDVAGGKLATTDLQDRLNADQVNGTALFELKVQGDSPESAQRLAAQVSRAFLQTLQRDAAQRATSHQDQIQRVITQLSTRIDKLAGSTEPGTADQIESLRAARSAVTRQSAALVANGIAQGDSASLTASPTAAASPIRPRPVLNVAAGLLLGLLLGVGLAWLRERVRPALHSGEDASEQTGVPVFASIPIRRRALPGDPVLNEAYEVLRANLVFSARDEGLRVVTFGSYNPGVGKTSAVEGFAYAAVRGGSNVLIVDGDLRVGALTKRLGQDESPGLNGVIDESCSPDDAIVSLAPGLDMLPAKAPAANPPSLLYSNRMRTLLDELRVRYDIIVFDSPPLAHLADASILASLSDGFVLVVRTGVTRPADLDAAAAALVQSGVSIVGLVVFEPRSIDKTYYPAMAKTRSMVPDSFSS
jgi:capsular exopolysaccharide synthesis family protein